MWTSRVFGEFGLGEEERRGEVGGLGVFCGVVFGSVVSFGSKIFGHLEQKKKIKKLKKKKEKEKKWRESLGPHFAFG